MKVSVNCTVTYTYEVDVPDDVSDLPCYCDGEDPVYKSICDTATKFDYVTDWDGIINSIVDDETGEILYED